MGVVTAVWLHQWNLAGLESWAQLREQWQGTVYVKALDGPHEMQEYDPSPLAWGFRTDPPGYPYNWVAEHATPWTVPTAEDSAQEGMTTGLLDGISPDGVILDLEPYQHFWQGNETDVATFIREYRAQSIGPFAISLDYRRMPFPGSMFIGHASRLLPQCYWPTFQRPWRVVLDGAKSALEEYSLPIEYVLPGDAAPDDLRAALTWVADRGATASIWLWQTITPENWEVILENAADPAPAMPTVDDLVNLLGYLQGDVATAIEDGIRAGLLAKTARERRAKLTAALDAVMTLRNAGK